MISDRIVDQIAEMLAARRRERFIRDAGYIKLARAILADDRGTSEPGGAAVADAA
jgi:hypothetical protein